MTQPAGVAHLVEQFGFWLGAVSIMSSRLPLSGLLRYQIVAKLLDFCPRKQV